jgi:glycosyltransferase involved in cell wall biosynthesis
MRIGLAARWLAQESGGAREYTQHLIHHLLLVDRRNDYVVFHNSKSSQGRFPAAREVVIPTSSRLLWDYVGLPIYAWKERIDLLWVPSYVIPWTVTGRAVVSFLDMAYFLMPKAYRFRDVQYMQRAIPGSLKRAAAVLAISENTRQDIARLFPDVGSKVFVTHLAPSPIYRRIADQKMLTSVREEYGLQEPFVFYPGSVSPRKGLSLLLQAFVRLHRERQVSHSLVITGGRTWGDSGIDSSLKQLPPGQVRILGHVSASILPALYNLADLCVYPSLFEGFGLPVLEAMICGCPVVCSSLTSLPEIAGDAAMLVDPNDVPALADAIFEALTDPELRSSLIEKGLTRVASFTWENTARETLGVFESVVQRNRIG